MMQIYRLIIRRHNKLLGHFESDTPWALEAMQDIAQRLLDCDGYQLETQVSEGERRLLESSSEGIRVLSTERVFKTATLIV